MLFRSDSRAEETLGDTGGRPLGLELLPDGRILICDAHQGLLRLAPVSAEVETLARVVDGTALRFCSNATAAVDGTIWFTESTDRFDFETFLGALLEHCPSGRLFRRDPDGTVHVVLDSLHFANGVTLTEDESGVLFAESGAARISRLDVRSGEVTRVAENLPGYPDNLSRLRDGRFWVAMPNPRDTLLERLATSPPLLRKALWRLPDWLVPEGRKTTWVMCLTEDGEVVADYQTSRRDFHMVTGVAAHEGRLFMASTQHDELLIAESALS